MQDFHFTMFCWQRETHKESNSKTIQRLVIVLQSNEKCHIRISNVTCHDG